MNDRLTEVDVRLPAVILVLAFTAVPVEVRTPSAVHVSLAVRSSDVLHNILGYVPLGVILAGLGRLPALGAALLISSVAEVCQLYAQHRHPSPVDVASNVSGAALGLLLAAWWGSRVPVVPLNARTGALAATLLVLCGGWLTVRGAGLLVSAEGLTSAGSLVGRWVFATGKNTIVSDVSGNGLDGWLVNGAAPVAGRGGTVLMLDGVDDHVDLPDVPALRLVGSMTVMAWIQPDAFPVDDAAIVSNHSAFHTSKSATVRGVQLDTTIDEGPRTIAFKLADACGRVMARYGVTPLSTGQWYHAAGVYDAAARRIDLYLNGQLDNGTLVGDVAAMLALPVSGVSIGRRPDRDTHGFAGLIDDVRIYSLALEQRDIQRAMDGVEPLPVPAQPGRRAQPRRLFTLLDRRDPVEGDCIASSASDAINPGLLVAYGLAAAIVVACFYRSGPGRSRAVCAASGILAALPLHAVSALVLPHSDVWLVCMAGAGGAVAAASLVHPAG